MDKEIALYIIETLIFGFIYKWMTIPKIWKVKFNLPDKFKSDKLKKYAPYIIASNHVSVIDSIILSRTPLSKVLIYSSFIKYILPLAWVFRVAQYIPNNKRTMKNCKLKLEMGDSIIVYPECSYGKSLNPKHLQNNLQKGAFNLCIYTEMPIIPVAIKGTGHAFIYGIIDISNITIDYCIPLKKSDDITELITKFKKSINAHLCL